MLSEFMMAFASDPVFVDKEGTYLIGTKGHMVCVRDGIIYDGFSDDDNLYAEC